MLDHIIHAHQLGLLIGLALAPVVLLCRIYLSPDPSARWALRGMFGGRGRRGR